MILFLPRQGFRWLLSLTSSALSTCKWGIRIRRLKSNPETLASRNNIVIHYHPSEQDVPKIRYRSYWITILCYEISLDYGAHMRSTRICK